jgi:NitT/TauT family transport system substrate-binding protein
MSADRPHLSPTTLILPCLPALGYFLPRAQLLTTPETTACVGAAVRAIVRVQRALRVDPHQAAGVGDPRFPPEAAAMIATLVEQDLPFYDPVIAESAVAALNSFAHGLGLLTAPIPYAQVVATRFRPLWYMEP